MEWLWEILEYVGEGLVFIGVLGEVLCERKLILQEDEARRDAIEGFSSWILIAGLALAFAALIGTNKYFDTTIATLNARASDANERSAALQKEAAHLREDADAIEAEIAPRRLDPNQEQKITDNCKRFKVLLTGKRVKVVSYALDTEGFVFAEQIVKTLRDSGMSVDDDAMSITPTGTVVTGINVFGTDSELAKKLAEAIGSSGKPIGVGYVAYDPTAGAIKIEYGAPASQATVLVGLKPLDPETVKELKRIMKPTLAPRNQ